MSLYDKKTKTGWKPAKDGQPWKYYINGKEKHMFHDIREFSIPRLRALKDEIGDLAGPTISRVWNFLSDSASIIGDIEERKGEMAVKSGKAMLSATGKTIEGAKDLTKKVNPFQVNDPRCWEEYGYPCSTEEYLQIKREEIRQEWGPYTTINPQPGGGELGDE